MLDAYVHLTKKLKNRLILSVVKGAMALHRIIGGKFLPRVKLPEFCSDYSNYSKTTLTTKEVHSYGKTHYCRLDDSIVDYAGLRID